MHYTNALHVKLNQVHFVALKRNDLFDVKEDTGAMLVVYRASKSSRVVLVAQFEICLSIRTIGHISLAVFIYSYVKYVRYCLWRYCEPMKISLMLNCGNAPQIDLIRSLGDWLAPGNFAVAMV